MKQERRWDLLYSFLGLFFLLFLSGEVLAASGITYQGRLLQPDGTPVTSSSVQFRLQIRTPGAQDCVMYEEIQTLDLSSTSGVFAISLADGTGFRQDTHTWTLFEALSNRKDFSFNPGDCTGVNSYSPDPTDNRKFRVFFDVGSGWEALPVQTINYIPMSIETYAVGGFPASSLFRVEDAGVLGNVTALTTTQYNNLVSLANGSSSVYEKSGELNGSALPSVSSGESVRWNGTSWESYSPLESGDETDPTVETFAKTSLPTCTTGQALISDGTTLSCVSVASGTLTESDIPQLTSAGNGVDGSAISGTIGGSTSINTSGDVTTTGDLSVSGGATTGSFSTRLFDLYDSDNSNKISFLAPATGDLTSDYALTFPLSAGTSGQVLSTDGSGTLSWISPSTGSVTGVSGTSPIQVSGTTSVTISVDDASTSQKGVVQLAASTDTTAGLVVQADDSRLTDSRDPSGTAGGDLSGTYPNPTVSKIQGISVSATDPTTAGHVLRYDGTQYTPSFIDVSDIRSNISGLGGDPTFPTSCTTSQTLTWSALTDAFTCSNISISASDVSSTAAGNLSATNVQAALEELDSDISGINTDVSDKVTKSGDTMTGALGFEDSYGIIDEDGNPRLTLSGDKTVIDGGPWDYVVLGNTVMGAQTGYGSLLNITTASAGADGVGLTVTGELGATGRSSVLIDVDEAQNDRYALRLTAMDQSVEILTATSTGNVGIGTNLPDRPLHVNGPMRLTASAEPTSPAAGDIYIDSSDSNKLKWYNGTGWQTAGGSGGVSFPLLAPLGSDSAPSYSFTGDSNTGIFSNGNEQISFASNGSESMRVTYESVEIGSAIGNSRAYLEVGSSTGLAPFIVGGPMTTDGINALQVGNNSLSGEIKAKITVGGLSSDVNDLRFFSATGAAGSESFTERLTIRGDSGNVGIGTNDPDAPLDVREQALVRRVTSSATPLFQLDDSIDNSPWVQFNTNGLSSGIGMSESNGRLSFGGESGIDLSFQTAVNFGENPAVGGTTRMIIKEGGNVGIGTEAPDTKLHIVGADGTTLKIVDGNQSAGRVLTSDANGVASWADAPAGGSGDFKKDGSVAMTGNIQLNGHYLSGDGGSEGVSVDSSGSVGIGTLSPQAQLHVYGSVGSNDTVETAVSNTDAGGASRLILMNDNTNAYLALMGSGTTSWLGGGNTLQLWNNANGPLVMGTNNAEGLRILSNRNVGIGATNPTHKLEVNGNMYASGNGVSYTTAGWARAYELPNGGVTMWKKGTGTYSRGIGKSGDMMYFMRSTADDGSATAVYDMVINSAGSVGIGTTSPATPLDVNGMITADGLYSAHDGTAVSVYGYNSGANYGVRGYSAGNYGIYGSTGAAGYGGVIGYSQNGSVYGILGHSNTYSFYGSGAAYIAGGVTSSASGYGFTQSDGTTMLRTWLGGSAWIGTTTMHALQLGANGGTAVTVNVPGNVGIGTTMPAQKLDVWGNIAVSGSTVHSSDRRLKENITPLRRSLDKILTLKGYNYYWKDKEISERRQVGVIAQEVKTVFPELVYQNPQSGYYSVNYEGLIPPLIESTKEIYGMCEEHSEKLIGHAREIAALKEENLKKDLQLMELRKENAVMKERLDRIEKTLGLK